MEHLNENYSDQSFALNEEKLNQVFFSNKAWLPYFSRLYDLFTIDKVKCIHDAKTIAVIAELLKLRAQGATKSYLFLLSKRFAQSGKLSELINFCSCEEFFKSIRSIETNFLKPINQHVLESSTDKNFML